MDIIKVLKSFDIFNREAVRFLSQKAINIFLLETKNKSQKAINLTSDKNSININIVNRPKAYTLLVSAQRRIEQKREAARKAVKL